MQGRPVFCNRGNLLLEVCVLVIIDRGHMKEFCISFAFSSRVQFMLLSSPLRFIACALSQSFPLLSAGLRQIRCRPADHGLHGYRLMMELQTCSF